MPHTKQDLTQGLFIVGRGRMGTSQNLDNAGGCNLNSASLFKCVCVLFLNFNKFLIMAEL